jgi:branched-chain amino acid aminotransferase
MTSSDFLQYAFFKGDLVPFESANLSIATHALHYGTAAFGGLRGVVVPSNPEQALLFRFDRHCKRLSESARLLNFHITPEEIGDIITKFVKKNAPKSSFYVRPLVYTSGLGIAPRVHNVEKEILVFGLLLGDFLPPGGVSCRISSWYRQEDRSVPLRGKIAGCYITSSLAKTEAVESGFDEAIFLNTRGKISEATGMNIFLVKNGVLITPGVNQDILEGITRHSIVELSRALEIPVEIREVDKTELFLADEVFLSGTAARITPVKKIENYTLPEKKTITMKLRDTLIAITEGRDPSYLHWIKSITYSDENN